MIITKSTATRMHAMARDWGERMATDFWFSAGNGDLVVASGATNISGLDSYGWTTTSIVYTNAVTADFMSSADDTPPNFSANASADLLRSPIMFGDYSHQLMVSKQLGYLPNRLCTEFYGAFITASANESATNMGFHNGAAIVMGIYSDGTNFQLSNGSTTDAGAAIDTSYHLWKICVDKALGTAEWFIDDVSQGTLVITQDVWPACFNAVASTTNRWALVWGHVWYE